MRRRNENCDYNYTIHIPSLLDICRCTFVFVINVGSTVPIYTRYFEINRSVRNITVRPNFVGKIIKISRNLILINR